MEEWLGKNPEFGQAGELPPTEPPIHEPEAPKPLEEAIIAPSEAEASDLISKNEVLSLLPEDWIVRAWSLGPQLLVRQLKHKLVSQSTLVTGSNQG